ncbi:MAG: hypothetical protein KF687_04055 [Cyclobacteriaceae bacterium]|nr:hypothetical protein [Cyclobacteriaceae bacterium]
MKIRKIMIALFVLMTVGCANMNQEEIHMPIHQLSYDVKETIKQYSVGFKQALSKVKATEFYNMSRYDIIAHDVVDNYLGLFSQNEKIFAQEIIRHPGFGLVLQADHKQNVDDVVNFSPEVSRLMHEFHYSVEQKTISYPLTSDIEYDKAGLQRELDEILSSFKRSIENNYALTTMEAQTMLMNIEFQRGILPDLIDLAITLEEGEEGSRVQWSWRRFLRIVAVVVATTAAAMIVGGVIGYGLAIAGVVGASAAIGALIGAGVGVVLGVVQISRGECPAEGWFQSSVPLLDWQDCNFV